jgi:hypothetical protein
VCPHGKCENFRPENFVCEGCRSGSEKECGKEGSVRMS